MQEEINLKWNSANNTKRDIPIHYLGISLDYVSLV